MPKPVIATRKKNPLTTSGGVACDRKSHMPTRSAFLTNQRREKTNEGGGNQYFVSSRSCVIAGCVMDVS